MSLGTPWTQALPVEEDEDRYVMVRVGGQRFGLPVGLVVEMLRLEGVTPLPQGPPHLRGVIDLRGRIIPIYDLRSSLGMPSVAQELHALEETLSQREADHRRWLEELERSVHDRRPFGLTTDPTRCAFGVWYQHYQTSNVLQSYLLQKFDAPHRRIHAIAHEVEGLMRRGERDGALSLIGSTRRDDLGEMIELFAQMRELLWETVREIAVVVQLPGQRPIAYSVDEVEAVDNVSRDLECERNTPGAELMSTAFVSGTRALCLLLTTAWFARQHP